MLLVVGSGVTYDANGNTTSDGTTAYTYDAENRVTSATNSSRGLTCYIYNADGQRVRKTYSTVGTCAAPTSSTPNDYLYDLDGHIVSILGIRNEIYLGNRHLATYVFGTTYFVHSDWLGTERARSSVSGAPYETATSLPFGDWLTSAGGSDPSPLHFTGKQHDYETGNDDFGARYYASVIGRFMTPDWSASPAAVPYASLGNPQSFNLYAYVGNNPISRTDPDGHFEVAVAAAAGSSFTLPSWAGTERAEQAGDALFAEINAQIKADDEAREAAQKAVQAQTQYTASLLGQNVPVSIVGGTADERAIIRARLDAAIGDINQHAGELSESDIKTIHNVKSITVDDSQRTSINQNTGAYNLKPGYVVAEGSSTAWIASTIAHDAYHMTQYQHGQVYNRQTAPRLEREANQFQIRVGAKFGLTPTELNYIRNDTHTLYNTPPY